MTVLKNFPNVGIDDIYLGNGVSEQYCMIALRAEKIPFESD